MCSATSVYALDFRVIMTSVGFRSLLSIEDENTAVFFKCGARSTIALRILYERTPSSDYTGPSPNQTYHEEMMTDSTRKGGKAKDRKLMGDGRTTDKIRKGEMEG